MFTTEEVYEDIDEAAWLGLSPEQTARNKAQEEAERIEADRLSEWESYTLSEIEAELAETEEAGGTDNFQLLPC